MFSFLIDFFFFYSFVCQRYMTSVKLYIVEDFSWLRLSPYLNLTFGNSSCWGRGAELSAKSLKTRAYQTYIFQLFKVLITVLLVNVYWFEIF